MQKIKFWPFVAAGVLIVAVSALVVMFLKALLVLPTSPGVW